MYLKCEDKRLTRKPSREDLKSYESSTKNMCFCVTQDVLGQLRRSGSSLACWSGRRPDPQRLPTCHANFHPGFRKIKSGGHVEAQ